MRLLKHVKMEWFESLSKDGQINWIESTCLSDAEKKECKSELKKIKCKDGERTEDITESTEVKPRSRKKRSKPDSGK